MECKGNTVSVEVWDPIVLDSDDETDTDDSEDEDGIWRTLPMFLLYSPTRFTRKATIASEAGEVCGQQELYDMIYTHFNDKRFGILWQRDHHARDITALAKLSLDGNFCGDYILHSRKDHPGKISESTVIEFVETNDMYRRLRFKTIELAGWFSINYTISAM
jgi:hypothetical protein